MNKILNKIRKKLTSAFPKCLNIFPLRFLRKLKIVKLKINKRLVPATLMIVMILGTLFAIAPWKKTPLVHAAWYNASWNYRQKIIIDHNKVPNTDQSDFPVLIKITDVNNAIFTSKAKDDGADIRFTQTNQTSDLSFEIETFSKTTHELIAWVKIPTLSHLTDTTIYLYYGNSSATAPSDAEKQATWSNGYAGVWHMGDAGPTTAVDSTSNGYGLTSAGGVTFGATGAIDGATSSNGSSKQLSRSLDGTTLTNFSISFIYTPTVSSGSIFSWAPTASAGTQFVFLKRASSSTIQYYINAGYNITETVNSGSFYYLTLTYNGTIYRSYVNGLPSGTWTGGKTYQSTATSMFLYNGYSGYTSGVLDETRISMTSARTPDWIATEYANQNSPETFFHISGEVSQVSAPLQASPAGWYDMAWGSRQPITLNPAHDKVPNTDQTDFPVLVKITDVSNDIWAKAQADGDDILFADTSGNKLAHEIEKYDNSTHELWAWVKVPTLSTGATTTIYMYYGNANSPNQQSATSVWSNGYAGVWHSKDATTTTIADSTGVNTGTKKAVGEPVEADGKIGKAENYDGTNDYVNVPDLANLDIAGTITIEAWIKLSSITQNNQTIVAKNTSSSSGYWLFYNFLTPNNNKFAFFGVNNLPAYSTVSPVINQWTHVVLIREGTNVTYYIGGVFDVTNNVGGTVNPVSNNPLRIGTRSENTTYPFNGLIDETRISSTARTPDWIATEFNNQNDPASFETFGAAETADTFAPNNPSAITALYSAGGSPILLNTGNDSTPYYSWPEPEAAGGATDQTGAYVSGVAGYYSYFGTSCGGGGADPAITRGVLSDTGSGLHYSTDVNVSVPDLTTNQGTYCLRLKTKDNAGNISSTTWQAATYGFDITSPNTPTFIAANPAGYSAVDSFDFSWPVATDVAGAGSSGLAGYQYERGGTSGDDWSSTISTSSIGSIVSYQTGENIFYVRSVDNAGNTSASVQTTYYYSNEVPTKPTSLTAIPELLDINSFAFSWTAPVHARPIVDYGYAINAAPTTGNLTWKGNNTASLTADHFATLQGVNTLYLVAKDDSGAYGVADASVASVTFTCATVAPPIPTTVSVTDSSDRLISRYMLTLQWLAGAGLDPASFAHYSIERSTDNITFAEIATSTSTAYIDTSLNNSTTYYYRIKAVDNAGSVSAASTTVSKMPTGKFDSPPQIISEPVVTIKTTSATISWVVNRASSSSIRFGKSESDLSRSQLNASEETSHSLEIVGLEPSTRYFYQVQSLDSFRDYSLDSAYSVTYHFDTPESPSIANVSVSNIALTSADISWETSTASNTRVLYGTSISYGAAIPENNDSMTTMHAVKLINLIHSSKYHFKIYGGDSDGNILSSDDYVFNTLPMPRISSISYTTDYSGAAPVMVVTWKTNVPTTSTISYFPKDGSATDANEEAKSAFTTDHTLTLSDLLDSTEYKFTLSGRDQFGNLVESDENIMVTDTDKRPAVITNLTVENNTIGSGENSKSQAVIYWQTDEPATSQVEYDEFLSTPDQYRKKSFDDQALKKEHLVIITDLDPMKLYHLRAVSKDKAQNTSYSEDRVIISGEAMVSPFSRIIDMFNNLFGWMTKYFK